MLNEIHKLRHFWIRIYASIKKFDVRVHWAFIVISIINNSFVNYQFHIDMKNLSCIDTNEKKKNNCCCCWSSWFCVEKIPAQNAKNPKSTEEFARSDLRFGQNTIWTIWLRIAGQSWQKRNRWAILMKSTSTEQQKRNTLAFVQNYLSNGASLCWQSSMNQSCYSCNKPGHMAKDCRIASAKAKSDRDEHLRDNQYVNSCGFLAKMGWVNIFGKFLRGHRSSFTSLNMTMPISDMAAMTMTNETEKEPDYLRIYLLRDFLFTDEVPRLSQYALRPCWILAHHIACLSSSLLQDLIFFTVSSADHFSSLSKLQTNGQRASKVSQYTHEINRVKKKMSMSSARCNPTAPAKLFQNSRCS